MFEPEVFRKQMYCIEESTCDIIGTFRRPLQWFDARGIVLPFPPCYAPVPITSGLPGPISACLRRGPHGYHYTGGKSVVAPRMNRFLAPTH